MQAQPVNAGRTAALVVTGVIAAFAARFVPVVGVPLAAMALASLAGSGQVALAVVTALAGAAAASWTDPYAAVFVVPALLLAGPGVVAAARRWPPVRVMLVLTGALFAASVASDALSFAAQGTSIVAQSAEAASQVVKVFGEALATTGDAATVKVMQAEIASLGKLVAMMWPSSYFETAALTAVLAVIAATRAAAARGAQVNLPPRLAEVDLSVHFVWPVAVGLLLLAASPVVDTDSRIVLAAGANLLVAARLAFLVQGMGVASSTMRKMGIGGPGRVIGSVMLLVADFLTYAVSVVGLADMWMNFRRLPRESGRHGGPEVSEEAS
ncbi:MAG: DUF2232 domain-containing protein [Actinobacteria bacterium]|nr:MAG: DUF2232 domain-containing protein [Actinomycetota bacterium]